MGQYIPRYFISMDSYYKFDQVVAFSLNMSENFGYASGSLNMADLDSSISEKQRKELCLLLQELKDRDSELNDMVRSHKEQLRAWELDRKRASFFENKSKKLQHELNKNNSQLQTYMAEIKLSETKNNSKDLALQTSQMQLKSIEHELSTSLEMEQNYQEKIETMEKSVKELKEQNVELSHHERELKQRINDDKEMLNQTQSSVNVLEENLDKVKVRLRESLRAETCLKTQVTEQQKICNQMKADLQAARDNISDKSKSLIACHEKIIQSKDQIQKLQQDIEYYEDIVKRKDEVILIQRSKQNRNDIEVRNLRKLFEEQQRDIVSLYNEIKKHSHTSVSVNGNISSCDDELLTRKTTDDNEDETRKGVKLDIASLLVNISRKSYEFAEHLTKFIDEDDCIVEMSDEEGNGKDVSPTKKLQQILSESREVVDGLEKTANTPIKIKQENVG